MFSQTSLRSAAPRKSLSLFAVALSVAALVPFGANAARQHTMSSFCAKLSCADGSSPSADLVMDAAGNLYGTTAAGGTNSSGTIFQLSRGQDGRWQRKVLHSFCRNGYPCSDGAMPAGKLAIDASGNLYGTTIGGGSNGSNGGVAFRLIPGGTRWTLKLLHTFCSGENCTDGKAPSSGLTYQGAASGAPYDGQSPLYGTTQYGGAQNQGTAFQLTPGARHWTEKVIYDFCSQAGCADGAQPWQGLLASANGDLFGVTYGRTAPQYGVAFQLSLSGGSWHVTVLYTFCQLANCADGYGPNALVMDAKGALYGTTYGGGANNWGTAFRLTPAGAYSILYNFCGEQYCADGAAPAAALAIGATGELYGTTYYGGNSYLDRDGLGGGTLFRLGAGGKHIVIHNFCSAAKCADGEYPNAGVLLDGNGNLFGTAQLGGKHGTMYLGGTAFQMSR